MENGAKFANSNLFMVNEQKYFASSDGSYIDQDIHRIWPTFNVTPQSISRRKIQNNARP
jgi:TldD protein